MNETRGVDGAKSALPRWLPTFRPGSNVLIRGPSLAGKRALALALLGGCSRDEEPVVLSVVAAASTVRRRLSEAGGADASADCYVVDAVHSQVTGRAMIRTDGGDRRTWYASSPNDLTGLGISTMRALAAVRSDGKRPRVVVDNLSTLLQYNSLERVYRFLHVMNGRVSATGGVTVQVVHADAHTDREVATLAHLFDGVVDVSTGAEADTVDVRMGHTEFSLPLAALRANVPAPAADTDSTTA
jgi:KaiC/GvpD/RAD55 family RecA-like ATPase